MHRSLLVAVGSNLPDAHGRTPLQVCLHAVERLSREPAFTLLSVSTWYRSAPVPLSNQPDYINGVLRMVATLHPHSILEHLNKVENEAGRKRSRVNSARVLDLDLLAVDNCVLNTSNLTLPHPRLHERAFVLHPLCDVAPDWRHPLLGLTATELRDRLPPQRIEPIPEKDLLSALASPT